MDNNFINLAERYYNALERFASDNKDHLKIDEAPDAVFEARLMPYLNKKERNLRKQKEEFSNTAKEAMKEYCHFEILKSYYYDCAKLWDPYTPFSQWIVLVKEFIYFIRFAEKCFMFRNESNIESTTDKSYAVYCEDKDNILYLRDFDTDVKIRISYTESEIRTMEIDTTNSILDYVNNGKSSTPMNVEFVNVLISREFGKQLCNEFRFIISEDPNYSNPSDKILMSNIRIICANLLELTFEEIFNEYINGFFEEELHDVTIKEFVNEEFWIREGD